MTLIGVKVYSFKKNIVWVDTLNHGFIHAQTSWFDAAEGIVSQANGCTSISADQFHGKMCFLLLYKPHIQTLGYIWI